jgi:hypothetical protein
LDLETESESQEYGIGDRQRGCDNLTCGEAFEVRKGLLIGCKEGLFVEGRELFGHTFFGKHGLKGVLERSRNGDLRGIRWRHLVCG